MATRIHQGLEDVDGLLGHLNATSDQDARGAAVNDVIARLSEVAVYVNTAAQLGYVTDAQTQNARTHLMTLAKRVAMPDAS